MGLFFAADPVVKFVMLLLVGASVWCWAIIFEKIRLIRRQKKHAAAFDELFWSGGSLNDLYNQTEMSRKARKPKYLYRPCVNGGGQR